MADQLVKIEIQITPEVRDKIIELARKRGFSNLENYLRALILADAKVPSVELNL
ncbi:MAG: hypothetical protein H7175_13840 [Burkholderiales bacterium]|nr:hypothetical protein [Anaerolineae bacterium]